MELKTRLRQPGRGGCYSPVRSRGCVHIRSPTLKNIAGAGKKEKENRRDFPEQCLLCKKRITRTDVNSRNIHIVILNNIKHEVHRICPNEIKKVTDLKEIIP
jgi:hypothetical protein